MNRFKKYVRRKQQTMSEINGELLNQYAVKGFVYQLWRLYPTEIDADPKLLEIARAAAHDRDKWPEEILP